MSDALARNTLYLTVASIGQKVLAFVYFLFLARIMQPENTGVYFLALSITTIFSVIADFGITPVVIREVAKRPSDALALVRRALGVKLPLMAIGAGASVLAAALLGYEAIVVQLVALACVVMLADAVSLLYYGVLRGHHVLQFESLGIFVGQIFTVVLGGTVLILDPNLFGLVASLVAGSVFNMLFSARRVVQLLGPSAIVPIFDRAWAGAFLKIAFPFALAGIFVKVYSYVDSVFLSMFLGTAAVGIYSVAYKLTYSFQFMPMAFVAALYPGMSALIQKDKAQLAHLFADSMWYMMLIATPITFGIFAIAPDLVLLAGEEYVSAAPVLQALVFVLVPIFLDFPIGSLLNASDRQGTKTAIMGVTMVVNVMANAVLIPLYGTIGAAYAALLSFWFLFLAGFYFVPRIIDYRLRELLRTIIPIAISGAVMAASAMFLRLHMDFLLVVPVAAVVYIAMLVLTRSINVNHLREARRLFARSKPPYAETSPHDS
jgi:O-antigen/teichoic acid export membrane protein